MSNDKPCRSSRVTSEALADGSLVLYDPASRMAYPLTTSGARIWEACDGEREVDTIVHELSALYDAPEEVIRRDVAAFLEALLELQLLEPRGGGKEP